jgi:hypothetical protein
VQINQDKRLLNLAGMLTWFKVAFCLLLLAAYCKGFIPVPPYPDRIGKKYSVWETMTRNCNMPSLERSVVLDGIKFGSKIGFELEPHDVDLSGHTWSDPNAFIAAAEATIKAIEFGTLNVNPSDIRRINKYFVIPFLQLLLICIPQYTYL